MNQVAAQLRSGMNREQFEEKKGEDFEAITDMYFDCNALDRLENNAPVAEAVDAADELVMDKDLGLFEMINAGDFATVSNNPVAA